MKASIAVVAVADGRVTKFQDFDNADDAASHVATYGGFVAANPGGKVKFWIVDGQTLTHNSAAQTTATNRATTLSEIERLESLVTQRRIRDSVTTDAGKEWLVAIEAEIAEQRELL